MLWSGISPSTVLRLPRLRAGLVAVLILALLMTLVTPLRLHAQFGIPAVIAAANAVVNYINRTIGGLLDAANSLLAQINQVMQSFSDLWQRTVYPLDLINQARALVSQLIGTIRGLTAAIHNVTVLSATLPNPASLESLIRNRATGDFARLEEAFQATFQPLPPSANIDAGDRERVDMSDALALGTLKTLKVSDQVTERTLEAARIIEDEAAQAAPGTAAFLTASALIAAVENQATMQRMLAAELRQEAGILAHANTMRKRRTAFAGKLRSDSTSLFK